MLTEAQAAEVRKALEADRARIVENAEGARSFSMDRDRDRVGRDSMDESVEEELYATKLRLHDRERFLLNKINNALQRLDEGTIDVCEDCEEEIGYARLKARPVTNLCISCKEEREGQET
jgi:DnaK suppressor protein